MCISKYNIQSGGLCRAGGRVRPSVKPPRFLEWIRVPQSAGLLELSGMQWVDRFSRNEAVTAAVHLQRDVGLMQTNVEVLDLTPSLSRKWRPE